MRVEKVWRGEVGTRDDRSPRIKMTRNLSLVIGKREPRELKVDLSAMIL